MKQELKRIEAALHQLADQRSRITVGSVPLRDPLAQVKSSIPGDQTTPQAPAPTLQVKKPVKSGTIAKISLPTFSPEAPKSVETKLPGTAVSPKPLPAEELEKSFTINLNEAPVPTLPRLKSPTFTTHRNAANPALTLNLLKEMETVVMGWQEELQQVLRQIQDLYLEGPIVDGWLESYANQDGGAPTFRHADVNCLMDYVEKMQGLVTQEPGSVPLSSETTPAEQDINAAGYRLCGLNEDGQLWFRHCPAEQVPSVGLAIARYQRLRILLSRKQYLEARLSQLAETLIGVHGKLNV